ncbi:Wzz/FepE/Etk N-terminal domain-containing protein [Peptostreptococcus porci]|uniref:Wzz/FepE/Etk N-terminal domain-containing protein n=1 Tax=Peptostreptococcus porci TaxID=2652282 RepID=UPI002A82F8FB|nr:Wzz/FepE/Etk N-terminal domain-containing protein [Peptostreptococcus porci]
MIKIMVLDYQNNLNVFLKDRKMDKELSLASIFKLIYKKKKLIVISTTLFLILGLIISKFVMVPTYSSTATVIMSPKFDTTQQISLNLLQTNVKLIDTYESIIYSEDILALVKKELNVDYSTKKLRKNIKITTNKDSQTFGIEVSDKSPKVAAQIANTVVKTLQSKVGDYYSGNVDIKLISEAKIPGEISSPNIKLNSVISVLLGILVGIFYIIIKELFNPTVTNINIIRNFGWLSLGKVNVLNSKKIRKNIKRLVISDVAMDGIGANLQLVIRNQGIKSLVVTSPEKNDILYNCVIKLSKGFAKSGKKVLLIDSNLKNPTLHRYFKVQNDCGLNDQLNNLDISAIKKTSITNISIITAGNGENSILEIFTPEKYDKMMRNLENVFDVIIFYTQPLKELSETQVISTYVNNVVLYIRKNQTRIEDLLDIKQLSNDYNINILGYIYETDGIE